MRPPTTAVEAAHALEATLVRQLLSASGAFRGSDAAGGQIHSDMFVDALADAVAARDGLGLTQTLLKALPGGPAGVGAPAGAGPDAGRGPSPGSAASPARVSELALAAGVRQTGGFGARVDPIDGTQKIHTGIDLAAPEGTPVLAIKGGVVTSAGPRGGYGNAVEIDHGGGVSTVYAHASALEVRAGQIVQQGQPIAAVGHTGRATGPHLHFEVRVDGRPRDPSRALNAYGIRAESPLGKAAGGPNP